MFLRFTLPCPTARTHAMKLYAEAEDAVISRCLFGNLQSPERRGREIIYPVAFDAHEVVMMFDVGVVAGGIGQEGDLRDEPFVLQRVERFVYGGQRDGRVSLTHPLEDLFGCRVIGRRQESVIDGQPLMRHAQSATLAMLHEMTEFLLNPRFFDLQWPFSLENDS